MRVGDTHYRSVWYDESSASVRCIDQTRLPHEFSILELVSLADACRAIKDMQVRGAPLIGVTAAFGVFLALREDAACYPQARAQLLATRPTAVNLRWALERMDLALAERPSAELAETALHTAVALADEDEQLCARIGKHGAALIERLWLEKGQPDRFNLLTHCNAGWLATVDWGTALSVVYKSVARGLPLHVYVDETRPRNQGASLSCWELGQAGIPHTLVVDNAGGQLMQQGQVDVCVVGSDRTTRSGDVCNKIGTYLKALAAFDNAVPFYAALPLSTVDFGISDGVRDIPIEERSAEEVTQVRGLGIDGQLADVLICPPGTPVANPGFDVTPARLVSGIITELGVFDASAEGMQQLERMARP